MISLGIDLGGTSIKLGAVENGAVLEEDTCPTPVSEGYEAVVRQIVRHARPLLKQYPEICAAGIGSPGLIDISSGTVCYSNNFGWTDKPLRDDLQAGLGIPASIANDAQCAALGEALHGAGKGYTRVAMLTIGTGVGGGFVQNGRLEPDRYASMAYIWGHMAMELDGKHCNCGRRGCLEAYASAGAVSRKSKLLYGQDTGTREVFAALRNGDALAREIVREFVEYLAEGAVNIANILRPQVIIIGGGVSGSCDLFLPEVNAHLEKHVYGYPYAPVTAVKAALGNAAGLVGAANLCAEK